MILDSNFDISVETFGTWQVLALHKAYDTLRYERSLRDIVHYHFARDPYIPEDAFGQNVIGAVIMDWCRAYTPCSKATCNNWIWQDKLYPGNRCRRCGTMWTTASTTTGKGKGYGKPAGKLIKAPRSWPEAPPGLPKVKPLKKTKVQQEATELLASTWTTLTEDTQHRLQAIGIGPTKPDEPELKDVLKSHMEALPQQVQDLVNKLTTPEPYTEREIAAKLKGRVTELKNLSMRKTQLQAKIDNVKAQYAALLTDMQELQGKLTEGQQSLKTLSDDYMKAVNQTPTLSELPTAHGEAEQIPMAVESFVHSLGISLTDEQKTQLHGLLKRPNNEQEDPTKRRKTDMPTLGKSGQCG